MQKTKLIALSGSLRAASRNTALLRAMQQLAPANINITLYQQLALIPAFNPDLGIDEFPIIAHLRDQIIQADGLIIASPEYAHGVSGALKNALDWLVNTPALVNKPVITLNAAPRAHHAFDSLQEILKMMSAHWIADASITLPIIGAIETAADIVADKVCHSAISLALICFTNEIERFKN
ncbi:NADPH-dependent FMN reductase [Iodobacter sp. CM08]|uniref:NADPH-dependent FMN reductase n=1 Tax=Iodobacter sp. CM08 TaxID=3085902 RepID=UPI0029811FC8|nr:NADPH-dependent FMN reductase [Iodobacter sp. CM08]MDW5418238.1 NADPH-dependent FMN reductase [Iodobacter sp. CM08]